MSAFKCKTNTLPDTVQFIRRNTKHKKDEHRKIERKKN